MATRKRMHITFNETHQAVLERLSAKWGLDATNTVRHCVMLIAEQLNIPTEKPARRGRAGTSEKK